MRVGECLDVVIIASDAAVASWHGAAGMIQRCAARRRVVGASVGAPRRAGPCAPAWVLPLEGRGIEGERIATAYAYLIHLYTVKSGHTACCCA